MAQQILFDAPPTSTGINSNQWASLKLMTRIFIDRHQTRVAMDLIEVAASKLTPGQHAELRGMFH